MYGFDGYDGRNKDTCSLNQAKAFHRDYMYYTGDSSYPLADISDGRFSHICSYIVYIQNLGSQYDYVTLGKYCLLVTATVTMRAYWAYGGALLTGVLALMMY